MSGVYPDVGDLHVEGDGSGGPSGVAYLRFPAITGTVDQAILRLRTSDNPSAGGGSGIVCVVADATWSEDTMTWMSRPAVGACTGTPTSVGGDTEVQWDVTPLYKAGSVPSLAIVSIDGDGAHYLSKESGGALRGPRLELQLSSAPPGSDAGSTITPMDASGGARVDGGAGSNPDSGGKGSVEGGCTCQAGRGGGSHHGIMALGLLLLVAGLARSRNRPRHRAVRVR
jgi:MYXO-CTERM domain-containing protein